MCSLEGICFLLGPLLCCNALAVVVTVADVFQTAICETSAQQFRVTSKEGKRAMLDAKKIARMSKVIAGGKLVAVGVLVGLILGIGGTIFFQNYNPPDEDKGVAATAVFGRFVERAELVGVSQDYCIVDKYPDVDTFFDLFDLPWTANSIWYRYAGTLKAGVNMETADMTSDGTNIHVVLDEPYIISNTPNMEVTGVLEENNNILNPIHVGDVDEIQRECVRISEENAVEGGLLEEARHQAESDITTLFKSALGDEYNVDFKWRDAS